MFYYRLNSFNPHYFDTLPRRYGPPISLRAVHTSPSTFTCPCASRLLISLHDDADAAYCRATLVFTSLGRWDLSEAGAITIEMTEATMKTTVYTQFSVTTASKAATKPPRAKNGKKTLVAISTTAKTIAMMTQHPNLAPHLLHTYQYLLRYRSQKVSAQKECLELRPRLVSVQRRLLSTILTTGQQQPLAESARKGAGQRTSR